MLPHLYLIRGLCIASDLPLGTFPRVDGSPDVVVRLGPASALAVRPSRPGRFEVRAGQIFLGAIGGGVVLVRHGREILVDSRPGLDRAALVRLVVEAGIDAVLEQRADLPQNRPLVSARVGSDSERSSAIRMEEALSY